MMSLPDNSRIELCQLVGPANVLTAKEDLIPYSFDGTAALQQMPACVVFARSTTEVSGVLKWANDAARAGLFYPPDPGSMKISTIGGNVAENSGGLRGLKYGVTRNYVMGLE